MEAVKELLAGTHPADPGIADQEVESQLETPVLEPSQELDWSRV